MKRWQVEGIVYIFFGHKGNYIIKLVAYSVSGQQSQIFYKYDIENETENG